MVKGLNRAAATGTWREMVKLVLREDTEQMKFVIYLSRFISDIITLFNCQNDQFVVP